MSHKGLSRRGFATVLAGTPLLAQQAQTPPPAVGQSRMGPPPETMPFAAPIEFTRKDVKAKIEPFPMTPGASDRRRL